MELHLASPPYDIQSDRTDNHTDYDLYGSKDMNIMIKVLGDVMRPGVHTNVFCFSLQFTLWYKILALEKKKLRASTGEDSGKSESTSK